MLERRSPVRHCRNVQGFQGGLVFKAHIICVSLNSRLESNTEEEEDKSSSRVSFLRD